MKSNVEVRPVRSFFDRRRFLRFPWELYKNDQNWTPPLLLNQKELLNYIRHPFYDQAEVQTFLAWREGRVVGRIAAIVNQGHLARYKDECGFFGFFESIDDQQVADALFDAAKAWLTERGMKRVRGPANPSMNYECGLLIDGFDSPATFMMTYNPPYYAQLIEGAGFRKGHDMYAYIGYREQLPEIEAKLGPLAEQAARRCEVEIRPMNTKNFTKDVELFLRLYNDSLVVNWGFVPLTDGEMKSLAFSLKLLLVPELTIVAESEGKGVGAIVGLPDYNPAIKKIDGRLFPFGFLTLLGVKKQVRRIRVLSINVAPEFQRWGLGLVLMRGLVPKAIEVDVRESEFSWVSEDNDLARMGLEKGGAKIYKSYRMYEFGPPSPPLPG